MRAILFQMILLCPAVAGAACTSSLVSSGTYGTAQGASGTAQYVVYMPQPASCYNGQVILYAHGYVAPGSPAGSWQSQLLLPDGTSIPSIVNSLGFGFAASGYSQDGLAILQGIQDTKALMNVVGGLSIPVQKYFLTGASEGGLVTAKSIESDQSYSGGVAVCGPIGSFQQQIDYFGDARVLFDYFFPGVLGAEWTSNNSTIPAKLMNDWTTKYLPAITTAVTSNPSATAQYLKTANIANGGSSSNDVAAITAVLWYNVFATNDATSKLGGNPYDNIGRFYTGSSNDALLNAHVARFAESAAALTQVPNYETDGLLLNPLVTLHTTADPVIPFWQETEYFIKVVNEHSLLQLNQLPAYAFGHCNVTSAQAETALLLMLLKAGG